ncbi:reticulon-2-like isoform X2 [Macrobrachium nipponense]|uniref:reticulon-2-like isoform X2 n=1 Tax=Macrobrachium nipponense TaxID=159736 RepID=UPI0030C7DC86
MSDFDLMSGFDKDNGSLGNSAAAPHTTSSSTTTTTQPPPPPPPSSSEGSNRDSLNLDDFEKVEADQLLGGGPPPPPTSLSSGIGSLAQNTQAAAVGLVDDIMAHVKNSGDDLFSNLTSAGFTTSNAEAKGKESSPMASDPFKMDFAPKDTTTKEVSSVPSDNMMFSGDFMSSSSSDDAKFSGLDVGFSSIPASESFTSNLLASAPPPPSTNLFDDSPKADEKPSMGFGGFDDFLSRDDDLLKGKQDFSLPDVKESVKGAAESLMDAFPSFGSQPPVVEEPLKRDPSPDFRNPTPPRTPTAAPVQDVLASPKQPTPPRTPTPPLREPTPPLVKEPTIPKQPTPPRTPTPPPREPTPPPRKPSPPPKAPTPPREPTPPPREPSPPPKAPTPPREPTPPPREPTPPPRVPTPPKKEPTPPPKEPTPPPRTPTPPAKLVFSAPVQEATVSPSRRSYTVSKGTENAFNVFKPMVDLIYWRDVKKTGVVFGSVMVILLSLAYLSLISVVAYTSLALLSGTITFRVYKNIMQAIQKSQDGHPFKTILEMDTDLPSEKVHEATDVIVSQINSTVSELKRLFLVEDLVDSVKFGCLLWCLTYLGSWFNGLTLVILAVVALFSLPKVYEQNQTQIDQYVGLVRSQVNDVMSKVKAALPIGNKEKTQ